MSSASSQYWTFLQLNSSGMVVAKGQAATQHFVEAECADSIPVSGGVANDRAESEERVPHKAIQTHLYAIMYSEAIVPPPEPSNSYHAQFALRCYISQQIIQTCQSLAQQFGTYYQFDRTDLLPLVLTDNGKPFPTEELVYNPKTKQSIPPYKSTAQTILEKYHPSKSTLTTWVKRLTRQHSDITEFLLDRGLYLISDWAILNDTPSAQLDRILTKQYQWIPAETETACLRLESYHEVYRLTHTPNSTCKDPTPEAWATMATLFQTKSGQFSTPEHFAEKLAQIAQKLRQHRIRARGGTIPDGLKAPPPEDLGASKKQWILDIITYDVDHSIEDDQKQLLHHYQQSFQTICDRTTAQVIRTRYETLCQRRQQRTRDKAPKYIQALQLFYSDHLKMSAIAPIIGLNRQEDVTHLLELNAMRADIQRLMSHELLNTMRQQLQQYADDSQIQAALHTLSTPFTPETAPPIAQAIFQDVEALIQEDLKTSYTPNSIETSSRLARSIVQGLSSFSMPSPYVTTA